MWERLDKAVNRHKVVSVEWCKGHASDEHNKEADKLAYNASNELNLNMYEIQEESTTS